MTYDCSMVGAKPLFIVCIEADNGWLDIGTVDSQGLGAAIYKKQWKIKYFTYFKILNDNNERHIMNPVRSTSST